MLRNSIIFTILINGHMHIVQWLHVNILKFEYFKVIFLDFKINNMNLLFLLIRIPILESLIQISQL